MDFDGHGTHVAGTVGEDANDLAEVGVAYNVQIMPVKVCFGFWDVQFALADAGQAITPPADAAGCPDDAIADGIRYAADHGAKVINVSLGGAGSSETLRDALLYAVSKGAFVATLGGQRLRGRQRDRVPGSLRRRDRRRHVGRSRSVPRARARTTRARRPAPRSPRRAATPDRARHCGLDHLAKRRSSCPDSTPGVVVFPRFDRYLDTAGAGHVDGVATRRRAGGAPRESGCDESRGHRGLDQGDGDRPRRRPAATMSSGLASFNPAPHCAASASSVS